MNGHLFIKWHFPSTYQVPSSVLGLEEREGTEAGPPGPALLDWPSVFEQ